RDSFFRSQAEAPGVGAGHRRKGGMASRMPRCARYRRIIRRNLGPALAVFRRPRKFIGNRILSSFSVEARSEPMIEQPTFRLSTQRLELYWRLMRLDKPIGIFLLLWPAVWALLIAGNGKPDILVTFV